MMKQNKETLDTIKFGLTPEQKEAVINRDSLTLECLVGSIYYLAKFAGLLGLNVQDVGGQTGWTTNEFKADLESIFRQSALRWTKGCKALITGKIVLLPTHLSGNGWVSKSQTSQFVLQRSWPGKVSG